MPEGRIVIQCRGRDRAKCETLTVKSGELRAFGFRHCVRVLVEADKAALRPSSDFFTGYEYRD